MKIKKFRGVFYKIVFAFIACIMCLGGSEMRVYAAEATICHTHEEKCYEEQWIQCVDRYDISNFYQDMYCGGCKKVSSVNVFVETYVCDYYGSYREFKRTGHCANCPTVVFMQENPESDTHERPGKVCVCGMDENTVVARAEFGQSTREWTNGEVTLNVTVTEPVAGCSMSPYTYSFSGGVANGATCTVSENGAYSVIVTAINGKQMTASLTVDNIDKSAPEIIQCKVDKEYPEYTAANIVLEGKDEGSGLADMAYSFDGGKTFVSSGVYQVTANGTYSVVLKDKAGNCSSSTITVSCFARKQEVSNTSQPEKSTQSAEVSVPVKTPASTSASKTEKGQTKDSQEEKKENVRNDEEYTALKEKVERSKFRVPLEQIPGVYSSLMRNNAEKNAVPMTLNVVKEKNEKAYVHKNGDAENLVKNITFEEEKNESGGTFAQVTKVTVACGVLLCIGMMVFLIVFLVKKQ